MGGKHRKLSSMQPLGDPPFLPLNSDEDIEKTANRLPHWEQEGRAYFVTFRLADSLPQTLLDTWDTEKAAWLELHPPPWSPAVEHEYHQQFSHRLELALDQGEGSCVLRSRNLAEVVGDALGFFEGERCRQFAWVVMPNHVHVLFAVHDPWTLASLLHSWKSFTANEINARQGSTGALWQKDYFDRLIRDANHFARCVRYIRNNGPMAKLTAAEYLHWESPEAKAI